jgi:hypothetical protein
LFLLEAEQTGHPFEAMELPASTVFRLLEVAFRVLLAAALLVLALGVLFIIYLESIDIDLYFWFLVIWWCGALLGLATAVLLKSVPLCLFSFYLALDGVLSAAIAYGIVSSGATTRDQGLLVWQLFLIFMLFPLELRFRPLRELFTQLRALVADRQFW